MRLYATTRSERAKKGQGGNNFLETEYNIGSTADSRQIAIVNLSRTLETVTLTILLEDGEKIVKTFSLKGEK